MDVAAAEFLTKDGRYDLDFKTPNNDGSHVVTGEELGDLYVSCSAFSLQHYRAFMDVPALLGTRPLPRSSPSSRSRTRLTRCC